MTQYDTLEYSKIEVADGLLESFEEPGYTYLHCTYTTSPMYVAGWWVNIYKTSYLIGKDGERLPLLHVLNIPFAPEKHYLKRFGDVLRFTLIFPAVPTDWVVFDFIEHCIDVTGLSILNIVRNNTGVYKVTIS